MLRIAGKAMHGTRMKTTTAHRRYRAPGLRLATRRLIRKGPFAAPTGGATGGRLSRAAGEPPRHEERPRSTGATSPGISSVEKATTAARSISFARSH